MRSILAGLAVVIVIGLGAIGCKSIFQSPPAGYPQPAPQNTPLPDLLATAFAAHPKALSTGLNRRTFIPSLVNYVPAAPLYSTSYYMLTVNTTTLYNMGCKIGQGDSVKPGSRDTVVVLDFGSPKKVGSEYGADLFWMGPVSISQISAAVKSFGQGYFNCVTPDLSSQVYVAIGTTNYHTDISNATDFFNHGAAWASMVNNINTWFINQGYSRQVIAVGADDIELSWNGPIISKAWVNGYNSTHKYDWYDFGTLDGCATRSYVSSTCGGGWTREDAWYATYGTLPAWPLPEIYLTNGVNAQQWAVLSQYSYSSKGYSFVFMGAFTQYQACVQSPGQCPGVDNSPVDGWVQLFNELRKSKGTYNVPRWSSDIKWWDGKVTVPTAGTPAVAGGRQDTSLYGYLVDSLSNSLSNPGLRADGRKLLQGKLSNAQSMLKLKDAVLSTPAARDPNNQPVLPKSLDPAFQSGVFDGAGGTFHSWEGSFQNHWQGVVNNDYLFVSAGSSADDPSQGIVMVMSVSDDRLTVHKAIYNGPAASATLQVVKVEWPTVFLASSNGQSLVFDASTQTFR